MAGKSLGSDSAYITPGEAAQILAVTLGQVNAWSRSGLLEPRYPEGRRPQKLGGKRFLREDVFALRELREQTKGGMKLPQLAMRAFVTSRKLEQRLEELMSYLGLTSVSLGLEDTQVRAFHAAVEDFIEHPDGLDQPELVEWARRLMAITDAYLALDAQVVGDKEGWSMFIAAGHELSKQCSPTTTARMYVDHACRSLRHAVYLHLRSTRGAREADRMFPKEGYVLDLVRTFYPKH